MQDHHGPLQISRHPDDGQKMRERSPERHPASMGRIRIRCS